jgi:hypothetical protein
VCIAGERIVNALTGLSPFFARKGNMNEPPQPVVAPAIPPLANLTDVERAADKQAKLSLLLGIASLVLIFPGVPAMILGLGARDKASPTGKRNATIGLGLGIVVCGLTVLLVVPSVIWSDLQADAKRKSCQPPNILQLKKGKADVAKNYDCVSPGGQAASADTDPEEVASAAASAAPEGVPAAIATAEATTRPLERSKLMQLAQNAVDGADFKIDPQDEWALYPPGTTDCMSREENGPPIRLDQPSSSDEFERKRLLADRKSIADRYVGTLIRFTGHGPLDTSSVSVGGEYGLALSAYDFNAGQYKLTLKASDMGKWPLGSVDPTIGVQRMTIEGDREIAKIGGKRLTVKGTSTESIYDNKSNIVIPVTVPVDEAEQWKKAGVGSVVILLRFVGMGLHKACKQDCGSLLGVYSCSSMNMGFGEYYRASLVGYEIKINEKLVAEKLFPSSK